MKRKNNTVKIDKIIIISIVFLFVLIVAKMLFIGISHKGDLNGIDLKEFASKRDTVKKTLYANRGTIFDINGNVLAQSVNSYTLIAYLEKSRTTDEKNPQHVVDQDYTAEKLAEFFSSHGNTKMTKEYILSLFNMKVENCNEDKTECSKKSLYQVQLGPGGVGLTELMKEEIEALDLPGLDFVKSTKRYYKMGNFAPYIIGYSLKNSAGEIVGQMGIESQYNDILKGKNGYTEYQRDAYNFQIPNTPSNTENPESGSNIFLTLDNTIQLKLETVIAEATSKYNMSWMVVTIADAKTGAIVASASNPNFNPNVLEIDSYLTPLSQYAYEPGSTMKIFSFMAAMENNVYDGTELYKSGTIKIGDVTIKDFNNVGWGEITYDQGFINSSNVAATKLAQKMGKAKLKNYYKSLGFGSKTGIELPNEESGKIAFNYDVEISNASFGQGILTTPVQTIQALTSIANDGVMLKPYIVDKIVNQDTDEVTYKGKKTIVGTVASKATTDKMKELMYTAVYDSITDAKYFKTKNVTIIGKSGTAQIASKKGGYLSGPYDYIRSFAGMFPKEDPQYIIYVSVKQIVGGFSNVAKSIAAMIDDIASYKNITETDTIKTESIKLPSYINKTVETATADLTNKALRTVLIGEGNIVIDQYPKKNALVSKSSIVYLITNNNNYRMPKIDGWSYNEVKNFCNLIKLKCNFENYGYVNEYNIIPGSIIPKNSSLNVKLSPIYDQYLITDEPDKKVE